MDEDDERQHPVTSGLTAVVAVGLAVGLFLGIVTFLGITVLGIGGGSGAGGGSTAGASLYLPTPSDDTGNVGPVISLSPDQPSDGYSSLPADTAGTSTQPTPGGLTLSAAQSAVGAGQRIQLSGTGPEGHTLVVQQLQNGAWVNFAGVTATVRAGVFQTWVETGQSGPQQWRMVDPNGNATSNPVTVMVG